MLDVGKVSVLPATPDVRGMILAVFSKVFLLKLVRGKERD